jgi:hypothetical protein
MMMVLYVAAADHILGERVVQALCQAVFTRKFDYTECYFILIATLNSRPGLSLKRAMN